ncbi:MAG: histidine kinase [Thermoanaerobaculia bacterium]|jgi:signal transduction histidine kinase
MEESSSRSSRESGARASSTGESRKEAVSLERARLARDLHDWLLQSMTGVALQLQTLHRLIDRDTSLAHDRLQEIQQAVTKEQRELRHFIESLDPRKPLGEEKQELVARLRDMASRISSHWSIDVVLEADPVVQLVPEALHPEIFGIVTEAVANAARHSSCSTVWVSIQRGAGVVSIRVADDGRGFAFTGRHDLEQLVAARRGPITLKERIQSLGGDLTIESSASGSVLYLSVPYSTEAR